MAEVVVIGAGLSGTLMAYELLPQLRRDDRLTVVSQGPVYHFVPSNPWVAVGWRKQSDIEINLVEIMKRKGIRLLTQGAQRVHPAENRVELVDGTSINYDYLVVATGPELAFDEIPGLGPDGHTESICHVDHASHAHEAFEKLAANPGPVLIGAVQGASCFGPAYEFLFILETELRRRKLRDRVPMTFVTSEPYIGHLGLDGVGDTKGLLESEMREKHIKWITNARIDRIEHGKMSVEEFAENGTVHKAHDLPFAYSMMLPAFRGVEAVRGIEKLTNPRGFVIVDKHQRNPAYQNVFAVGVCVAIAPVGTTPVPVGVPKTGFMIESMVTATAMNIGALLRDQEPTAQPTWNAICLADFGDSGVAFLAQPQIPPRNVNWSSKGEWVHHAKVAFEKYFLRKIRRGEREPFYERFVLDRLNIAKVKEVRVKEVRTGT
jgi:sulfide:quinone oxidoreductase